MHEWQIREALPNDIAFIYATWLNSYRADSHYRKTCTKYIFFKEYPKVIDHILNRARTLVACLKDDSNVIIGYLTYEDPRAAHYAFTKEGFRQMGVLSSLWNHAFGKEDPKGILTSHKTRCIETTLEHYGVTHNPFLLMKRGLDGTTEET